MNLRAIPNNSETEERRRYDCNGNGCDMFLEVQEERIKDLHEEGTATATATATTDSLNQTQALPNATQQANGTQPIAIYNIIDSGNTASNDIQPQIPDNVLIEMMSKNAENTPAESEIFRQMNDTLLQIDNSIDNLAKKGYPVADPQSAVMYDERIYPMMESIEQKMAYMENLKFLPQIVEYMKLLDTKLLELLTLNQGNPELLLRTQEIRDILSNIYVLNKETANDKTIEDRINNVIQLLQQIEAKDITVNVSHTDIPNIIELTNDVDNSVETIYLDNITTKEAETCKYNCYSNPQWIV